MLLGKLPWLAGLLLLVLLAIPAHTFRPVRNRHGRLHDAREPDQYPKDNPFANPTPAAKAVPDSNLRPKVTFKAYSDVVIKQMPYTDLTIDRMQYSDLTIDRMLYSDLTIDRLPSPAPGQDSLFERFATQTLDYLQEVMAQNTPAPQVALGNPGMINIPTATGGPAPRPHSPFPGPPRPENTLAPEVDNPGMINIPTATGGPAPRPHSPFPGPPRPENTLAPNYPGMIEVPTTGRPRPHSPFPGPPRAENTLAPDYPGMIEVPTTGRPYPNSPPPSRPKPENTLAPAADSAFERFAARAAPLAHDLKTPPPPYPPNNGISDKWNKPLWFFLGSLCFFLISLIVNVQLQISVRNEKKKKAGTSRDAGGKHKYQGEHLKLGTMNPGRKKQDDPKTGNLSTASTFVSGQDADGKESQHNPKSMAIAMEKWNELAAAQRGMQEASDDSDEQPRVRPERKGNMTTRTMRSQVSPV